MARFSTIAYPAIWWSWTPPLVYVRFLDDPLGNLAVFFIPGVILGTAGSAGTMRMTRTMMLEVLPQDYIRTAWSKGLREKIVVIRHAIKNAFIPVITLIGLELPILVGGAVIIENIFNLPGLGRFMVLALERPRLSGGIRGEPVLRERRAGEQPVYRSGVCVPRSAHPLPVTG